MATVVDHNKNVIMYKLYKDTEKPNLIRPHYIVNFTINYYNFFDQI